MITESQEHYILSLWEELRVTPEVELYMLTKQEASETIEDLLYLRRRQHQQGTYERGIVNEK